MWVRVTASEAMNYQEWIENNKPVWHWRFNGESNFRQTTVPCHLPLSADVEVVRFSIGAVALCVSDGGTIAVCPAAVSDVTHEYRRRPPANNALPAGEESVTAVIPAVKDHELRDASVAMGWLFGTPLEHKPGGIRWQETKLPACRAAQLMIRVPEENPVCYLALPGERLAIQITLPGFPSETATLRVVALPFAAEVN